MLGPFTHSSMSRKSMMPENQRFLNIAMQKINMRKVCPNKLQARYDFLFRSKSFKIATNGKPLAF